VAYFPKKRTTLDDIDLFLYNFKNNTSKKIYQFNALLQGYPNVIKFNLQETKIGVLIIGGYVDTFPIKPEPEYDSLEDYFIRMAVCKSLNNSQINNSQIKEKLHS
jgi:hypothetical protein